MCSVAVPKRRGQGRVSDMAMEKKSSPNSWKTPVASTGMDSITSASSQQRNATLESQGKAGPGTSTLFGVNFYLEGPRWRTPQRGEVGIPACGLPNQAPW